MLQANPVNPLCARLFSSSAPIEAYPVFGSISLCAVALRKRVVNWSSVRSDCYDAESIPIALAGLTSSEFPTCLRKLQCRRNEWLRALIQACGAGCHYVLRDTQCDGQRSLGKAPVLASRIFFLSAVERPAKTSGRQEQQACFICCKEQ